MLEILSLWEVSTAVMYAGPGLWHKLVTMLRKLCGIVSEYGPVTISYNGNFSNGANFHIFCMKLKIQK